MHVNHVVVLTLAGFSLTAQETPGPPKNRVNFYSLEKEAALGKQIAAELHQRTTPIDNLGVQNYVDRLGQRITAQIPGAKVPFTFSVIADDPCRTIHEPAALPGGYVFVPAALFLAAQDEAEFAGMLAHAMEHIAQGHGTRQATRGELINYGSIPLVFMGGWGGGCSEEKAGQGVPLGFMALQRRVELEADSLAVQTMAHAGFDPMALVRYIERVQSQPGSAMQTSSSALPDRDRRVASMRVIIEKLPPANYAAPVDGFGAVRQELHRLVERQAPADVPPTLKRVPPTLKRPSDRD